MTEELRERVIAALLDLWRWWRKAGHPDTEEEKAGITFDRLIALIAAEYEARLDIERHEGMRWKDRAKQAERIVEQIGGPGAAERFHELLEAEARIKELEEKQEEAEGGGDERP